MTKKLSVRFVIILFLVFGCEPKPQRAYIITKTDDNNWTTSAKIECDSVNMITEKHAIYWVDGRKFNLYAKSYIKVFSNPYYKDSKLK